MRRLARILVLLTLAAALLGGAHAQAAPDQLRTFTRAELDVVKVLTAQEAAWNRGDIDGYASSYKDSPDTLFLSSEIIRGFAPLLQHYKKSYPNKEAMGTLSFSDLEPHVLDEHFAVVLGKYTLDRSRKAGGAAEGVFSLVLEKTNIGWKIIVDHAN